MREPRIDIVFSGTSAINIESIYGMHLVDSPDIISAPLKDYEVEDYPEKDGVVIYPYVSEKAFDYKVSLVYFGNKETANAKVETFREAFFDGNTSPRKARYITLYNRYKKVMIKGYLSSLDGGDAEFDNEKDTWMIDLTIKVTNPKDCNFNIT